MMTRRMLPARRGMLSSVGAVLLVALVALLLPSPARASSDGELAVQSRVLPVGASVPSWQSLGEVAEQRKLDRQAVETEFEGGVVPWETVGAAREWGRVATEPSGVASQEAAASSASGDVGVQAITYPDPARAMSAAECRKGLGADKKFFVKSRFAVCSGALFHQLWTQKGKPVGESRFVVLVVATVALDSREVRYTHHFTDMAKTGNTKTSALMITPKVTVPFISPATAKYQQGGAVPGAKSFDQFRADKSFLHTMTVTPGQGSTGATDLVAAVYEASIQMKFPPGYKVIGDSGGDLFMIPPRWEAAKYLRNSTGGGKSEKRGAASFAVVGTLVYSAKAGAVERAAALHIRQAFTKPEETQPYMSAKKVPGQTPRDALNRLYHDTDRQEENRVAAIAQCKRHFGADYAKGGKQCDEYPFAATYQGAAHFSYDPEVKKFNYSVKPIDGKENEAGGLLLKSFYAKNRLIDGFDDGFIVKITS